MGGKMGGTCTRERGNGWEMEWEGEWEGIVHEREGMGGREIGWEGE